MSREKRSDGTCITRRALMSSVGGTVLATVLAKDAVASSKARKATKNMQLSLAAYSVRKALTSGEMDLFKFIDWCSDLDLPGTELTSYYFEEGFDTAYLRRLRNRAFRRGVTISGTAIRNDFCMPPGPEKQQQVDEVKKWIDHAAELFAPHIRIFAGNVPDGVDKKTAITWTADGIKAVLDHAAKRGIFIGLENHGGITALVSDHLAICEEVGRHPWFGVNLDTGNFHEDPYTDLALAAPWAVNVQVKVEMHEGGKEVPANFERIRDLLVESGYKGWVALEYEAEPDPLIAVPKYLEELRGLFSI